MTVKSSERGHGGGPPSKLDLDPTLWDRALAIARLGRFKSHVAATVGVNRETLYRWVASTPARTLAYAAAEAEGEEALLLVALRGGDEGKAAAWYLERWRQTRFGARARHDVKHSGGLRHEHDVSPDTLAELIALVTSDEE